MKTTLLRTLFLFSSFSLAVANAGSFTSNKTMKLDFSQTDIDTSKVKITYEYYCNYTKKFLDILEGRIGERTVSCGKSSSDLQISNGQLIVPGIEQFKSAKGDDLNRYGMQIKIDYNGVNLIWISAVQKESIEKFFKKDFNLTFKKFELNDLEVTFKGLNLINAPEFDGEKTPVTTYFYLKGGKDQNILDTDFTRSFKWYLTPYSYINQGDISKMGKISIAPHYHAFLNNEEANLLLQVYAKDKEDKFVSANDITLPFTQEAISNLKEVELVK